MDHQFVSNGNKVHYIKVGEGSPMLFLHNGAGMWQCWQHQVAYFSKSHTVYALDWPGCGGSEYPEGALSMPVLDRTLDDFVAHEKLEKFILVGNCIGASAALSFSLKSGHKLEKLILLNICPGDLLFPKFMPKQFVIDLENRPKVKALIAKIMPWVYNRWVIRSMFPKRLFGKNMNRNDDFYKLYQYRLFMKVQEQSRNDMFYKAYTYNLAPILQHKKAPKHMLLWGEENEVADLKNMGALHYEMLQSDEFHVIKSAGHLCMYEKPDEINAIITRYLNG